jgi:drug/metabolite transporter (DMT)-like permease
LVILLSLLAAVVYGAADFFGGLASRKTSPTLVVVLSQLSGAAVLAAAWLFVPGRFYAEDLRWGVGAGIAGGLAIILLYRALAVGRMGVVSPITAVIGASVPVAFGLFTGERPAPAALAGVVFAFVAVGLVSANAETRRLSLREPGLGYALGSGTLIGALFILISRGHHDAGFAVVATTRATSLVLLTSLLLARRASFRPAPGSLPTILGAGALDMAANVLYVAAARDGMLAIVAVLTSLYPASTVFLARVILDERLTRSQWAGVACAALGVALIAR